MAYGVQRRPDGIVIRGTKAIVTGAPYMHEFLVMPCRTHTAADADFAVCCAVPVDAPGVTIVARPAGRPGEAAAKFSAKYGQSTGVVLFDDVFVPHDRVFLAGETEDAFARRVVEDSQTTRDGAADFGTAFHAGAERVANTLEVDDEHPAAAWLRHFRVWYQGNAALLNWTEKVLVNPVSALNHPPT